MPETGLRQTFSSFTGLLSAGGAAGAAPAGTRSGAGPMLRPPRLCDIVAGDSGSAASTSTSYVFPSIVMFSFMALPQGDVGRAGRGTLWVRRVGNPPLAPANGVPSGSRAACQAVGDERVALTDRDENSARTRLFVFRYLARAFESAPQWLSIAGVMALALQPVGRLDRHTPLLCPCTCAD